MQFFSKIYLKYLINICIIYIIYIIIKTIYYLYHLIYLVPNILTENPSSLRIVFHRSNAIVYH